MERETRGDLLRTVEGQKEQIQRLETRLRDVVNAYKGLLKEKEALQSSVETLQSLLKSQTSSSSRGQTLATQSDGRAEPTADALAACSPAEHGQPTADDVYRSSESDKSGRESNGDGGESQHLKEQLATLATSMSTLMEEKDRMVAAYQAEKKSLKQTYEDKLKKCEEQLSASDGEGKKLQDLCSDLRSKLKQERMEREKAQSDQAVALREAQQLLSEERVTNEDLEHQVEDLKKELHVNTRLASQATIERYESMVAELTSQLQDLRARLKDADHQASLPHPQMLQLQRELADAKVQQRLMVAKEQSRADQVEERARDSIQQSEARTAELEKKLAELSEVVGEYERLRCQDQLALQKVKERVAQLDSENTELAMRTAAVGRGGTSSAQFADTSSNGVSIGGGMGGQASGEEATEALLHDMLVLKERLKAGRTTPINWQALFMPDELALVWEDVHKKCEEELNQVKEEFERYKLRAQSVLKTKSTKDNSSTTKELDALKAQVVGLREKLSTAMQERHDEDEKHSHTAEELRRMIKRLEAERQQERALAEADYQQKTSVLERELHRHRDRTIALLVEKDREIELLRSFSSSSSRNLVNGCDTSSALTLLASPAAVTAREATPPLSSAIVTDLLRSSSDSGNVAGCLLQLSEEQARRHGEVATLQRQKRELEAELRELTLSVAAREQHYTDLLGALKEEVRRRDRNDARLHRLGGSRSEEPSSESEAEGVGLEYLKNVVLSYLTSPGAGGRRQQMLHAIATILQFSPQERQQAIIASTSSSWWRHKT